MWARDQRPRVNRSNVDLRRIADPENAVAGIDYKIALTGGEKALVRVRG